MDAEEILDQQNHKAFKGLLIFWLMRDSLAFTVITVEACYKFCCCSR